MGSDPRVVAMLNAAKREEYERISTRSLTDMLAAADAADREAGIVRVNTRDDATAERAAQALYEHHKMNGSDEAFERVWMTDARLVLTALAEEDS